MSDHPNPQDNLTHELSTGQQEGQVSQTCAVTEKRAYCLTMNSESLAQEGIHQGDLLLVHPNEPIEAGKLYVYRTNCTPEQVYVGKLDVHQDHFCFKTAEGEKSFSPSDVTVLGKIRWSMHEVD